MIDWSEYTKGVVNLYGFEYTCYYKYYCDDTIEMYCAIDNYQTVQYTSDKSLVVEV